MEAVCTTKKREDNLKNEDGLKDEDDLKDEDNIKNEDNLNIKTTSLYMKTTSKWKQPDLEDHT